MYECVLVYICMSVCWYVCVCVCIEGGGGGGGGGCREYEIHTHKQSEGGHREECSAIQPKDLLTPLTHIKLH